MSWRVIFSCSSNRLHYFVQGVYASCSFAQAMIDLAIDRKQGEKLGDAAQRHDEQEFDVAKVNRDILGAFQLEQTCERRAQT